MVNFGYVVIGVCFIFLGLFAGVMGIDEETGWGGKTAAVVTCLVAVGVGVLGILTGTGVVG